jgi:adenylate cyclase
VLQAALEERNRDVPDDQAIRARIGINLGEVIVDGDDRFGEGVNIAARLEQLAETGGICVSDKVAREVEKKLAFGFVPMGPQKVKNIAEPVEAFRVSRETGPSRRRKSGRPGWPVMAAALAVLAACLAAVFILKPWATPRPDGPPVLAVLPFANLTGDPSLDYLGLAVPDGVLTMLSSSPVLRVVARSASLTTPAGDPPEQIAWRLGADYLLEGSIRKGALGHQVAARLLDGPTGEQVWAGTFGGQGLDVAALQEAVARDVYVELGSSEGVVAGQEVPLAWDRLSDDPAEYDIFLRGAGALLTWTDQGRQDAFRILTEGIAQFPRSALLRTLLAGVHSSLVTDHLTDNPRREMDVAWAQLQEAALKPDMTMLERWLLHYVRADVTPSVTGDLAAAFADAVEAQRLVPYEPLSALSMSRVATNAGHPELGIAWAEFAAEAMKPAIWPADNLAWAYLHGGRNADALQLYESAERRCDLCYAVALVRAGREDAARKIVAEVMVYWPAASVAIARLDETDRFPAMVAPLRA